MNITPPISVRKIVLLLIVILPFFAGCKKTKVAPNSDTTDRVFRIQASSDKDFVLSVLTYRKSPTDTVKYAEFRGNLELNQGFTPNIGDNVQVSSVSNRGSYLNVLIIYKGKTLSVPESVKGIKGLSSTFAYEVKD